jgi:hypothetical protein
MTEPAFALSRHDVEAKIVKHCWENEAFREEFTADPAGAFVKYLEIPAASLPSIVVHQEPAGSWHIVLPPRPANANQLSEQDLETVAGGAAGIVQGLVSMTAMPVSIAVSVASVTSAVVSLKQNQGW